VYPPPGAPASPKTAAAAPATRRGLTWGTIANQVVTVFMVLAVITLLVVNVGPLFLPYRVYTVLSGSMQPTIPIGAEVVATPVPASQVGVGDIITFARPGHPDQLVTHRVIAIETDGRGGQQWVTRGDANGIPDQWRIPVRGVGLKYRFNLPLLGYVLVELASPLGRICFILAPALLLAAVLLNDLWKTADRKPPVGG
jgi:signal peptidase